MRASRRIVPEATPRARTAAFLSASAACETPHPCLQMTRPPAPRPEGRLQARTRVDPELRSPKGHSPLRGTARLRLRKFYSREFRPCRPPFLPLGTVARLSLRPR